MSPAEPPPLSSDLVTSAREVHYQIREGLRVNLSFGDLGAKAAEVMFIAAEDTAELTDVPVEAAGQAFVEWMINQHLAYRANLVKSGRAEATKNPPA